MDYKDDVKYPETCKMAVEKGIIINTIQCGNDARMHQVLEGHRRQGRAGPTCRSPRTGPRCGSSRRTTSGLAEINAELENSTLVYGSKEKQQKDQEFRLKSLDGAKSEPAKPGDPKGAGPASRLRPRRATRRPRPARSCRRRRGRVRRRHRRAGAGGAGISGGFGGGFGGGLAPPAAIAPGLAADRAVFNALRGGINSYDLLADIKAGKVKLDTLKDEELPDELRKLPKEKRQAYLDEMEKKREKLREEARDLAKKRDEFTKKKLEEEGKKDKEGFDQKVEELLQKQAKKFGIDYLINVAARGIARREAASGSVEPHPRLATARLSSSRYFSRGTSNAPSRSVCSVSICVSTSSNPRSCSRSNSADQSHLRPVRPPEEHALRREEPIQAHPVDAAGQFAVLPGLDAVGEPQPVQVLVRAIISRVIQVPSGRSPQARMTSPNARLMVISNLPERMVRASRRGTCRPARMSKIALGSGDHQRIGSPSLNHGNTPSA